MEYDGTERPANLQDREVVEGNGRQRHPWAECDLTRSGVPARDFALGRLVS